MFVNLGVWQLHRADEKKALMAARELRGQDAPVLLDGGQADLEALRYRRVEVAGEYDAAHQFLLDNRMHGQQPGYEVLTPLRIAGSGMAVLINRGWIPLGADRTRPPEPTLAATSARLSGVVEHFPGVGLKLKGAEVPAAGWPSVVQVAEPERLAERLGYPVLPYQVLLDESAGGGYVRAWRENRLTPEKNLGYALQWFLFALVATVLYVRHGLKAGKRTATPDPRPHRLIPPMTQPNPSQTRSRAVIVIIALLSVIPFVLAWYYAKHPELVTSRSNYGQLAMPPRPIDPAELLKTPISPPEALAETKGHWVLLHVVAGACDAACTDSLHKTHQVRLMVNKDIARVKRLLLTPANAPGIDELLKTDDALAAAGASDTVSRILAEAMDQPPADDMVFLLDPLGNLVLWYTGGFDPYGLLKDLKHLLKASQIG